MKPAGIGDTLLVPISQPDNMSSIGPRNLMDQITEVRDSVYTSYGTISTGYTRNQLLNEFIRVFAYFSHTN